MPDDGSDHSSGADNSPEADRRADADHSPDPDTCSLCELPTPEPPVSEESVPGVYCCRGCLQIARALDGPDTADRNA